MPHRATFVLPAVVALLLVTVPPGLAQDAQERSAYVPHPPILIQGDDDLTLGGVPNAALGVVDGSGTSQDPYVISGWEIGPPPGPNDRGTVPAMCSIRVQDTSSHLLIEGNRIRHGDAGEALGDAGPTPDVGDGICLDWVEHVTVRSNVVEAVHGHAVHVGVGTDVVVEGNVLNGTRDAGHGVELEIVPDAEVRGNTIRSFPAGVHAVRDAVVEGNVLRDNGIAVDVTSYAAEVRNNTLEGNNVGVLAKYTHPLALDDNVLRDNGHALEARDGADVTARGNVVEGNDVAVLAENHGCCTRANDTTYVDATGNWWGDADGPDAGDLDVQDEDSVVDVDPWLETEPLAAGADVTADGCTLPTGCDVQLLS